MYYEDYGRDMIRSRFPAYAERIAVGLAGEGSECFGFDDEFSRDHDFGAGFCLWLTDEDFEAIAGEINAAFESMPSPYLGYPRRERICSGAARIGALNTTDFYRRFTGLDRAPRTLGEWLVMPEEHLAVATNGEVFSDPLGHFTDIRESLLAFYPEDIRLKKLAARLGRMGQAGQYNLPRSVKRGERVAAVHAVAEFAQNAESAVYLLNRRYKPFYKWAHHGMRELPLLEDVYGLLARLGELMTCGQENRFTAGIGETEIEEAVEETSVSVIRELRAQGLTDAPGDFLLPHAESVKAHIAHDALRGLHLFAE
jgi:hypothetical protein